MMGQTNLCLGDLLLELTTRIVKMPPTIEKVSDRHGHNVFSAEMAAQL
jgi:hypothetical protein